MRPLIAKWRGRAADLLPGGEASSTAKSGSTAHDSFSPTTPRVSQESASGLVHDDGLQPTETHGPWKASMMEQQVHLMKQQVKLIEQQETLTQEGQEVAMLQQEIASQQEELTRRQEELAAQQAELSTRHEQLTERQTTLTKRLEQLAEQQAKVMWEQEELIATNGHRIRRISQHPTGPEDPFRNALSGQRGAAPAVERQYSRGRPSQHYEDAVETRDGSSTIKEPLPHYHDSIQDASPTLSAHEQSPSSNDFQKRGDHQMAMNHRMETNGLTKELNYTHRHKEQNGFAPSVPPMHMDPAASERMREAIEQGHARVVSQDDLYQARAKRLEQRSRRGRGGAERNRRHS
ncbi:hypothetical protein HIM_00474 [Hirsutella minnesotensis 3608]|nr:hypothetical protein HIM_00474 [Hirsutella minnesotensis 3608]